MEEIATPSERRCPACGAAMLAEARFCGACGMESAPATTQATPAVEPDAAALASDAAQSGDGRLCLWCGVRSPLEATSCAACGAVFPTPEGDAALEHAAQARIQAMESELKQPRAGWWPFRAR